MGLIKRVRRRLFFRSGPGNFYWGVYRDFGEAQRSIRSGMTVGYDNEAAAGFYREKLDVFDPADYPLLFWLRPLIREGVKVFDFGGHIGLHFYGYRRVLDLPTSTRWVVSEVPAVCAAGAKLAAERGVSGQLTFVESLDACAGTDVLISAGAFQYLELDHLPKGLAKAGAAAPGHVLLNRIPVTEGESFYTVQDTGVFAAPYGVFSRKRLTGEMEKLGYELVESWKNPGHHCIIRNAPESSVDEYSGFYFRRRAGARG